jgi:hypothetical protein
MMRNMFRRAGKRPPRKTVGNHSRTASESHFSRKQLLVVAVALAAVLSALVAYRAARLGTRDTPISSNAAPLDNSRRFIGGADDGYVEAGSCAVCHPKIASTYSQTGMARSFYRARPEKMVEDFANANTYYHAPSDERYTMIERGGEYFQRRHQLAEGREVNVFERQIHYVMVSGNHARTYLGYRLPALSRTGARSHQGGVLGRRRREGPDCDFKPRAPRSRASARNLHAVSPRNHHALIAPRERAIRSWSFFLPAH